MLPLEAQPTHIGLDRLHVFGFFRNGVGIVETEVGLPAVFIGQPKIKANRFGVANVQIAIGFGWKARVNPARVFTAGEVIFNDLLDKI